MSFGVFSSCQTFCFRRTSLVKKRILVRGGLMKEGESSWQAEETGAFLIHWDRKGGDEGVGPLRLTLGLQSPRRDSELGSRLSLGSRGH